MSDTAVNNDIAMSDTATGDAAGSDTPTAPELVERYDRMILDPGMRDLYGSTGFYNVGEWSRHPASLPEACHALVERHLDEPGTRPEAGTPWRLLDAGCGLGAGTQLAARHYPGAEVLGINISPTQIEYARHHYPGPEYRVMDASALDLPDASVDRIISVEAAFHFDSRASFLRGARTVLKPGGRMILSDIIFRPGPWACAWSVPDANAVQGLDAYAAICRDAGYVVESVEDITEWTWFGFCRYLQRMEGMESFAADLRHAVRAYLLVSLRRPE